MRYLPGSGGRAVTWAGVTIVFERAQDALVSSKVWRRVRDKGQLSL
jgi:hypothetical protein